MSFSKYEIHCNIKGDNINLHFSPGSGGTDVYEGGGGGGGVLVDGEGPSGGQLGPGGEEHGDSYGAGGGGRYTDVPTSTGYDGVIILDLI